MRRECRPWRISKAEIVEREREERFWFWFLFVAFEACKAKGARGFNVRVWLARIAVNEKG